MSRRLKDGRQAAKSGTAGSVVVFLHGYGADGADLLGLAEPLAPHLPDTVFRAPDAPDRCQGNPYGFQWFPIPGMDGSTVEESLAAFARARADLHAYLDRVLAEEKLPPERLALVGFSQGTMMALQTAPERASPLACVVGFSGRIVEPAALATARSRPPVLLIHGDQDPVVPFDNLAHAGALLADAGFETYSHVMKGTAHGIAPDGLSVALGFLKKHLPPL
ncbi:alpha/beta hydrolase [Frigidibacter sp. ROC022]|uniref:alpha/beta hydrolase n=1 Tax=Frigidibacter sp. ROC022 TaxID=2971796 RepID=UPI00215AADEC|nr:alpha/beta fold hydrolase [Frigidibacter sp. ROC022]MCR8725193.1 alpha/beta fold hydrolase [Frigidibacter sp. ROC022]